MFVHPRVVEVFRYAFAVMRFYESDYFVRQLVLFGKRYAIRNVLYYLLRVLFGREVGMKIVVFGIFGKECGIPQLAYVVVKRACTGKQRVRPDCLRNFGRKVGYLHGMLERSWSFFRQFPEYGIVRVRQFQQCYVGSEFEQFFRKEDERVGEHQKNAVCQQCEQMVPFEHREIVVNDQDIAEIHYEIADRYYACRAHELRPLRKVLYAVDGHHAYRNLQQYESIRHVNLERCDKDRYYVGEQTGARVDFVLAEDADDYG